MAKIEMIKKEIIWREILYQSLEKNKREFTQESLVKKLEEKMELLVKKDFDKEKLLEASLITPSCGTGSMPPNKAEKALELTKAVSETMRAKYFH